MKAKFFPGLLLAASILAGACSSPPRLAPASPTSFEADSAEAALRQFFQHLAAGEYEQAAPLYGGSYAPLQDLNPGLDGGDRPALLRNACEVNGYQCLPVLEVLKQEEMAENQFLLSVGFQAEDGSSYVRGSCCGASTEQEPRQSIFQFRVSQTAAGEHQVMGMPVYAP